MLKKDLKNSKNAGNSLVQLHSTWEFTPEDLNFSLYGYFTSKDEDLGVNQRVEGNTYLWWYFQELF